MNPISHKPVATGSMAAYYAIAMLYEVEALTSKNVQKRISVVAE